MKPFRKRTYAGPGDFFDDLRFLAANRRTLNRLMHGGGLDPAFRERVMLAVTQVNDCRFCIHAHGKMAREAGLPPDEVRALLGGSFADCPEDELPALLRAREWAEAGCAPDALPEGPLTERYGAETARALVLAMRLIRAGNLAGNTADRFLYWVSRGRMGGD